jgi:resuscitation-promoting factor RpfB
MSASSPRSRLLRRARGVLSLSVLGLAAVPLIGWSHVVEVSVDGEVLSTRTYAATVGDVLDQLDVPVGPSDEVSPAPQVPLGDVETIDVDRAITVDVAIDGAVVRRVSAPVSTVAGVLAAADLDLRGEAEIEPAWTTPVEDGDTIELALPRTLQVTVDGTTREVETFAATVGGALLAAGVELGPDDLVDWELDAAVQPYANVTVERIAFDEVVEEVALDHDEVRRRTDDLREGVTRVEVEGRDGLRRDTYRVERVDGEEVDRELVSSEVEREPRDQVVLVGTFVPPPPAPPPPAPASRPASPPTSSGTDGSVWDRLARCESGGNWAHRGGTYHGGLQFHPSTWDTHKPAGAPRYAYEASRAQQIQAGESVKRAQGWGAWPHCSRAIGVR